MTLAHIKDNKNFWTVVLNGKPHQFDHTHAEYDALVECVKVGDADAFLEVFSVGTVIENWSEGNFAFRDGYLYYGQDEQIASQPTERIIDMLKQGWDHKPMLRYLDNLYENVSQRAVQESYEWSMHKGLPITEDGYMIGYKGVAVYRGEDRQDKLGRTLTNGDLVDKYTGHSFRNNVGDLNHMPRRQVCDDHTKGCEAGLHIGTFEYAEGWAGSGGAVVLVKFNPADIVSVPSDCSCQKIRVSKYEVLEIARGIIEDAVFAGYGDDDEDDEDFYEDDEYGYEDDDYDDFGL
jgi:hypothetical protein